MLHYCVGTKFALQAIAFTLSCIMISSSCYSHQDKDKISAALPAAETASGQSLKPGSSYQDTLTVLPGTVVFFNPDTQQLSRIREQFDKNRYASLEHDCYFQMKHAKKVIHDHWPKLKIAESNRHRYLCFSSKNGNSILLDLDHSRDICGIYLFDGIKQPQLTDMMNIDTELTNYFRK